MINSVVIMGRLTFEPELRTTPSGLSVLNFQIACDRNYQAQGEERKADFIDCQAWRQKAEFIAKYFHKGDMIALEGSIQTDNFTDKNGNNRKTVTISVSNASFCGSKKDKPNIDVNGEPDASHQAPPAYASADESDFEEIIDDDDDLPF